MFDEQQRTFVEKEGEKTSNLTYSHTNCDDETIFTSSASESSLSRQLLTFAESCLMQQSSSSDNE